MVLSYTFFKPYISKICNSFSLYIYIYINWVFINYNEYIVTLTVILIVKGITKEKKKIVWFHPHKNDSRLKIS